jgi:type II secretory pathway component PulF
LTNQTHKIKKGKLNRNTKYENKRQLKRNGWSICFVQKKKKTQQNFKYSSSSNFFHKTSNLSLANAFEGK